MSVIYLPAPDICATRAHAVCILMYQGIWKVNDTVVGRSSSKAGSSEQMRNFRDSMPDEWSNEWKEKEREVEERREAAELRRKNELAITWQIKLARLGRSGTYYNSISKLPNFDQSETLMDKMGVNSGGALEIWETRVKSWRMEDIRDNPSFSFASWVLLVA
ncbi:hypothetical protein PILCRDRAFT_92336 [Piloderma croceum F 1598]|uniref:Uncharacterized protein n=1 Tax=Piloderma croceum (strain F 1598) TaxID=765440 RepID=A0A0C3F4P0_PILCF|nr:hypothetical protein PILCRDRAFT_92336 [Piloderma croceum F 1598]